MTLLEMGMRVAGTCTTELQIHFVVNVVMFNLNEL
jgi:hypothetical protein